MAGNLRRRHEKELKDGASLDYGAFFECGRGSYTTHNEHAVVSRGDGKLSYLGGGFTARLRTKPMSTPRQAVTQAA